jgi:hypothetical protein
VVFDDVSTVAEVVRGMVAQATALIHRRLAELAAGSRLAA